MNRSQSKYFNTALRMNEALIALLERKDFAFITVKEICQEAGVNRSTFYLHYETVGDLLDETVDNLLSRLSQKFEQSDRLNTEQIECAPEEQLILITPKYLIPYLEFVKENAGVFRVIALRPGAIRADAIYRDHYAEIIRAILHRFGVDEREGSYRMTFYLNGIFALVNEWICGGCREEVGQMAEMLVSCIFPRVGSLPCR